MRGANSVLLYLDSDFETPRATRAVKKSTGTDWSIGCDERAKARVTIPNGGAMRKGRLGALHNGFG